VASAWRLLGDTVDVNEKLYKAMIWIQGSDQPGQRVSVAARNLEEAKGKLEAEYGKGNVYYLRNEEDAAAPR
jgi:ribosomal protein L31E